MSAAWPNTPGRRRPEWKVTPRVFPSSITILALPTFTKIMPVKKIPVTNRDVLLRPAVQAQYRAMYSRASQILTSNPTAGYRNVKKQLHREFGDVVTEIVARALVEQYRAEYPVSATHFDKRRDRRIFYDAQTEDIRKYLELHFSMNHSRVVSLALRWLLVSITRMSVADILAQSGVDSMGFKSAFRLCIGQNKKKMGGTK